MSNKTVAIDVTTANDHMLSQNQIAQICPDGIITITPDGKIAGVNAAAIEMLGWAESDIIGQPIDRLSPDDERLRNLGMPGEPSRKPGGRRIADWRGVNAMRGDGSRFPANIWVASETLDGAGHLTIFLRDMSDLTAKETAVGVAQAELSKAKGYNDLLSLVAEHTNDIVIITDADGFTIWANKSMERLTGYRVGEMIGRKPGVLLQGPDTDLEAVAALSRAVKAGEPIRCELVNYSKAGERYWLEMNISPIRDAAGQVQKFIAVERDVTAAKLRQQEFEIAKRTAEKAEQRLRAAIEAMSEGFAIYDENDRLVMANEAHLRLHSGIADLLKPGARFEDLMRSLVERGIVDPEGENPEEWMAKQRKARAAADSGETIVRFADGRWMLRRERRTPQGEMVGIRSDITAFKRHEAELKAAGEKAEAADRAKSDFVAMISHEIRTPINAIMGFNQLMLVSELTEKQRERANIIKASSNHLLQLVNNVLDLAKITSDSIELEVEPFRLEELVSSVLISLTPLADKNNLALSLTTHMPPETCVVGDSGRVRQILINLIGNAIKFTAHGSVDVSVVEQNAGFLFKITDTGDGISKDKIAVIFDRFSQLGSFADRAQGSGLGLAITKRLVDIMRGTISVTSDLGHGSVFAVWLPLQRPEAAGDTGALVGGPTIQAEDQQRIRPMFDILVAEDHPSNQALISEILDSIGCRVSMAENGEQALQQLDAADFDLIIMDNQMPVMSGMEAIEKIRARTDWKMQIPIIALTANAMRGAEKAYLAIGVNEYITKPLDVNQVIGSVKRLAEQGRKIRNERPVAV